MPGLLQKPLQLKDSRDKEEANTMQGSDELGDIFATIEEWKPCGKKITNHDFTLDAKGFICLKSSFGRFYKLDTIFQLFRCAVFFRSNS